MTKYCSECGSELAINGKFCGSCGSPIPVVVQHCPTCGQEWSGEKTPKAPSQDKAKKVTSPKEVPTTKNDSVVVAVNTSAAIQPVYGTLYVAGKDCRNCGEANMANKTCTTCESEN